MNKPDIPPIGSTQECITMLKGITFDNLDSVEKYKLYICREFFKTHFLEFKEEELNIIFSFPNFKKNVTSSIGNNILETCIKQNKLYPVLLDSWFPPQKSNKSLLYDYLKIINEKENIPQINKFYQYHAETVLSLYKDTTIIQKTDKLCELALKSNPVNILYNNK